MINSEQDVKWECLNEDCKHVWYEEYKFSYVECPKCECKNIRENE